MTATASQFGIWSNRAQPSIGTNQSGANLRSTDYDGRMPIPQWDRVIDRSRTWQDLLGLHQDTVTIPGQEFDVTTPVATFAALNPTFEPGNTDLDVTAPVATFAGLNPTFEAITNLDVTAPVATFTGLNPTFEPGNTDLDVTVPVATFAALNPNFEAGNTDLDVTAPTATFAGLNPTFEAGNTDLDITAPTATFAALDVIFESEAAGPQNFDVIASILSAIALNVVFAGPVPPISPPTGLRYKCCSVCNCCDVFLKPRF